MCSHWHTGGSQLNGEPGDDLLFRPDKSHPLDDGLRRWLADHPAEAAALADHPSGPLPITHRTGRRKNGWPGTGRRFASIWITATGPSSTSAIFTTKASLQAATTPSLSRTSHTHEASSATDRSATARPARNPSHSATPSSARNRPRVPEFRDRMTRNGARAVLPEPKALALVYPGCVGIHPPKTMDLFNPRAGIECAVADLMGCSGPPRKQPEVSRAGAGARSGSCR
jgi:hypothetical protein